jgi:hypothetical protein
VKGSLSGIGDGLFSGYGNASGAALSLPKFTRRPAVHAPGGHGKLFESNT